MRIITGTKAGMNLLGPRDLNTRPITDRVKESLFSKSQQNGPFFKARMNALIKIINS